MSAQERMLQSLWQEPEPADEAWPALHLSDVFRIYRAGAVETVALRGLELSVQRGEFIAVLGPSGCGKSTMLALAAALDEPSAGEVRVGKRSLQKMDERERTSFRARELSLVFQNENLWPMLSARENVALALRLAGVREPLAIADRALEKFGLGDRSNHVARALSGGEQQRVAVAAAFAREAPLVLADEPTGELDDRNERIVLDALAHLRERRNATVVMVTHSHSVAASADRVVQMRDGKVIA